MTPQQISKFRQTVDTYYRAYGRDLPWRHAPFSPYKILVSEIMLQQTQVRRVIPKYQEFLHRFPTILSLADAPLSDVLKVWSGLGYNRRAKYIHDAAKFLSLKPVPWTLMDQVTCKGIGFNTAAAVMTYAYNQPIAFIETNIRTVFIYHFFASSAEIHDKEILKLLELSLSEEVKEQPRAWALPKRGPMRKTRDLSHREFMWALMDYGAYLKSTVGNVARASKHYSKQAKFAGSKRQIRGYALRLLGGSALSLEQLGKYIQDERLINVLADLVDEGLISKDKTGYVLAR